MQGKIALPDLRLTGNSNYEKKNRNSCFELYGLLLHSCHFQKIKIFMFLKVAACIYYLQTV